MERRDFLSFSLTFVVILSLIAVEPPMKSSQSASAQAAAGGKCSQTSCCSLETILDILISEHLVEKFQHQTLILWQKMGKY